MAKSDRQILIVTLEPISERMAGPAIRALELGKELAKDFEVIIFSPCKTDAAVSAAIASQSKLQLITGKSKKQLYELAQNCQIAFIQSNVLKTFPKLSELCKYLVIDLYDPFLFSLLAEWGKDSFISSTSYRLMHQVLEKHMRLADFSVCASERQRDYWLGRYCAIGRLTPELYALDASFRKLIDVVPFGLSEIPAHKTASAIKGIVPGINKDDFVLLWGGGIWEWFDPLTIIKAVAALSAKYSKLKLFFMGLKSPNPQVALMDMAVRAKALSDELGLTNRHVFFSEQWVAYEERANYLLDADVAVTAHFDLCETHFSFRTRILDYLWAGLPILTSTGDDLAAQIDKRCGVALPFKDVDAWSSTIEKLMQDQSLLANYAKESRELAKQFYWQNVVKPLKEFCHNPYKLPEHKKITMPNLIERAGSVYKRGGRELLVNRSKALVKDALETKN